MYLAHVVGGLSMSEISRLFGRDRTTVAHACARVEDRRDDAVFDRSLDFLELGLMAALTPHEGGAR
jgi:chromosomal replication initiation ATPase DnaA